jgi:hypothetical protein
VAVDVRNSRVRVVEVGDRMAIREGVFRDSDVE